jgi:alpha-L-rhamnosidase
VRSRASAEPEAGSLPWSDAATVVALRCQVPEGVLAVGRDSLRLSWSVTAAAPTITQLGYEIQAAADSAFEALLASSGIIDGAEQIAVAAPGGPLSSREVRNFRVRILTARGWTSWSPTLRVEAGLLEPGDWSALAVTLPHDPGSEAQAPAPILRREFRIPGPVARARLHATSLGLNRVTLNGKPVSVDLLQPGWTSYAHRLLSDTYDVTDLLVHGTNVIAATLGDGWYRGRLGWDPVDDRAKYGREIALVAQLEVELASGELMRIVTDESWRVSTAELRSADLYDGSFIDLRERKPGWDEVGYDDGAWSHVAIVPFDRARIEPRVAAPVVVADTIPVKVPASRGPVVIDGGQNIAGFVRLNVRGKRGSRVVVRHAEVLEPDGSLHTRSLRSAKATDTYVLADEAETMLEPVFTFHGFRYAEVDTEAEILNAEFVAISSARKRRAWFECSDPALNRFHENVVWSQRDNFVSLPTDCPQRDERLGWTGDAQAFARTAATLFDTYAFWKSWLRDLALDQDDELGVPSVVPNVVVSGVHRFGRAGWADAATIVPWAVYESYGDPQILSAQLASMTSWVASLRARRAADGLLRPSAQFGDWLDPDAPGERPWEAKTDPDYLANAFFAHSARLLARAAGISRERELASEYAALSDDVAMRTWARWGSHAATTQTGCAVALELGIAPTRERQGIAAALAQLVRKAHGRVETGFLGTPLVLPALADGGFFDEAYLMLLRREMPSWLYQVSKGATTVWERWDAIRPDGSIHPGNMRSPESAEEGHMLSFNHYAYGAVIDWVYRNLAGLAPDLEQPGYRHVVFAPKPPTGISWARASVDTSFGEVAIDWRIDEGSLAAEIRLPFGTSGSFVAPTTEQSRIVVNGVDTAGPIRFGSGHHLVLVTQPHIAGLR